MRSLLVLLVLVFAGIGLVDGQTSIQTDSRLATSIHEIGSANTSFNTVTITTHHKNGLYFAYAGGDSGALDAFVLAEDGLLTPLASYTLTTTNATVRGLTSASIDGNDFLFVGNKGGNCVEVFQINDDGTLNRVYVVNDNEQTYLGTVITLQVIHIKKASYLFVGGLEAEPGLTCFKISKHGELKHVQSTKDDDQLFTDGIIGMYTHQINGQTFLFTGGFQDNGVSSFKVKRNGHFENVNNIADNTTDRYLTGTYPVNGVTLGENNYVLVGHRHHKYYKRLNFIKKKDFVFHGDGLSVFKVSNKGELVPHFVLVDNDTTKLSGQTRIEVLPLNPSQAIVAVGTRDDESIQLCLLREDGILTPIGQLGVGFPIYYGLAAQQINSNLFLLAGSVSGDKKKIVSYQIMISE